MGTGKGHEISCFHSPNVKGRAESEKTEMGAGLAAPATVAVYLADSLGLGQVPVTGHSVGHE